MGVNVAVGAGTEGVAVAGARGGSAICVGTAALVDAAMGVDAMRVRLEWLRSRMAGVHALTTKSSKMTNQANCLFNWCSSHSLASGAKASELERLREEKLPPAPHFTEPGKWQ